MKTAVINVNKLKSRLKKIKKNTWAVMALFAFIAAVGASVLVQKQVKLRSRAGAGPAVLMVVPSSDNVSLGEEGTLEISLNPNGASVSGVELVITYDSNVIEVSSLTVGDFFTSDYGSPVEIVKDISTPGMIHYAVGFPLGSNHSSTSIGTVATLVYSGKTAGSSAVSFVTDTTIQPHTIVSDNLGQDVLDTGTNGTIVVSGGARLYFDSLTPDNPQVVGNTFSVQVMADTASQEIDGVDAIVTFDSSTLSVTDLDQGTGSGLTSYPALTYDNSAGTVTISANIGSSGSVSSVSGSSIHIGTITFSANQVTSGTNITFDYVVGDRNDSNIVLAGTSESSDPTDILSSVDTLTIIAQATSPTTTAVPTTQPTITTTPTSAPTTTTTAVPTTTTTTTPTSAPLSSQSVTIKVRFQGRLRLNVSNAKTISLQYKLALASGYLSATTTTSTDGEFTLSFVPGTYTFLLDAPGYLARKVDNIDIVSGNLYLDLSSAILRGGDFNSDGEINEIDYTLSFIPNFGTSNSTVDLDGSGKVNNLDFTIMRNNWNLVDDVLQ